jgi:hypothetical protein
MNRYRLSSAHSLPVLAVASALSRCSGRSGFNPPPMTSNDDTKCDDTCTLELIRQCFPPDNSSDGGDSSAGTFMEEDLTDISLSDEYESASDASESSVEDHDSNLSLFPSPPPQSSPSDASTSSTHFVPFLVFMPHPRQANTTRPPNYTHHGHSRSSLMHTKWFWHVRRIEWLDWDARAAALERAYDGIEVQPASCSALRLPRMARSSSPPCECLPNCTPSSIDTSLYSLHANRPRWPRTANSPRFYLADGKYSGEDEEDYESMVAEPLFISNFMVGEPF